jgi:hypothetical protein
MNNAIFSNGIPMYRIAAPKVPSPIDRYATSIDASSSDDMTLLYTPWSWSSTTFRRSGDGDADGDDMGRYQLRGAPIDL